MIFPKVTYVLVTIADIFGVAKESVILRVYMFLST